MINLTGLQSFSRRDQVFKFLINNDELKIDTSKGDILYIEDLSVSFDGFKAIDNLNLYLREGELRCIIGPNGAGKTTLMDIITGKTRPDSGSVYLGQNINLLEYNESEIAQLGIGRKFQKPTVFEQHTVFENLELSLASNKGVWYTLTAQQSGEDIDRCDEILMQAGLIEMKHIPAALLSHGQKQWLEIAMLVMQKPRVLLVDEPVSGMTQQEMEKTAELLNSLAGEHTVVVVEHDIDFIRSIASQVTVLHQGRVLAEGSMEQVQSNPAVVEVYLGE
ncbi:MAG: urea transport system ATP-binding protein [Polaribacter sp.]|jgi:urea transport system ATP-binding protein